MPGTMTDLDQRLAHLEQGLEELNRGLNQLIEGLPYLKVLAGNEAAIARQELENELIYQSALRLGRKQKNTPNRKKRKP